MILSGELITDWLYGIALFANAALFIPQAWRIFKTKDAKGSSLVTFAGFNIIQLLGLVNGIYHNDKALIFGQIISFTACGLVTLQLLVYRFRKSNG